ncbi:hypothetical protein LOK49_LG12G01530 [Camellia lanceoleosa]|uniref:Uncharacterized protein n=1 Tax=Camellia lanceoleosa TaxID=1840588 RepID=A0ACC0FTV0_9ERIC|nr:hypothetical protein LOK49_LG12G01530 [Camellia lanceoleosa]
MKRTATDLHLRISLKRDGGRRDRRGGQRGSGHRLRRGYGSRMGKVIVRYPHVHFDQSWGNIALGKPMFRMFRVSQFHRVINDYDCDYLFAQNGLVAYKDGKLIGTQSLRSYLGEEKLKVRPFSRSFLHLEEAHNLTKQTTLDLLILRCITIADLDIAIKRFVLNIRPKMVSVLCEKFAHLNVTFSIEGKISFDVFPQGWDKTYCLRYVDDFHEIHFFEDKTYKGRNDHEIYESERTMGHTVTSPEDTVRQCTALFLSKQV